MKQTIEKFKQRASEAGQEFQKASQDDLLLLRNLGFPDEFIEFYSACEPEIAFEFGPRIYPVEHVVEMNTEVGPGFALQPHGILAFADTCSGDAYCVDVNTLNQDNSHPILLYSHETFGQETTAEQISNERKEVASSLREFLERAYVDEISEEPNFGF